MHSFQIYGQLCSKFVYRTKRKLSLYSTKGSRKKVPPLVVRPLREGGEVGKVWATKKKRTFFVKSSDDH